MRIDVCVPAHNEERIIGETIRKLRQELAELPHDTQIIVVANGSSDATESIARSSGVRVISRLTPGKGGAITAAAKESDADIFVFIDADLSADPNDIKAVLSPVLSDDCDIAIGSRLVNVEIVERSRVRTGTSQVFNLLQRILLGIPAKDTQCGLKCMNAQARRLLAQCEENGWFLDLELLARAHKAGMRISEIPVHWDEHRYPNRKSKLRLLRDGFGALAAMIRIRRRLVSQ